MTADLRAVLGGTEKRPSASGRQFICPWVFTYQGKQLKSYYKAWRARVQEGGAARHAVARLQTNGGPEPGQGRCARNGWRCR